MAFVYWIHLPEHTDMFSEGYIGVTIKSVEERYQGHLYAVKYGSNLKVHNAIRKHEAMQVDTILEGSAEYCYLIEGKLRSTPNIGYNLAVGGSVSPMTGKTHTQEVVENLRAISKKRMENPLARKLLSDTLKGSKHTQEAKDKISVAVKGRKHSLESRALMSVVRKDSYKAKDAWETPRADKDMWANALLIYDFMQTRKRVGWKSTAEKFITTKTKVKTICQKIKDGWLPYEDHAYLLWLAEYKNIKECYGT